MINVVLTGNQTLIQEGMISVLSASENISIVGHAETEEEIHVMKFSCAANVIVIDQNFISKALFKKDSGITPLFDFKNVLVISDIHGRNEILEWIELGMQNHVNRACTPNEFLSAVKATANEEQYFCSQTTKILFGDKQLRSNENLPSLSHREAEIIQLISVGLSNKEIADKLFLSFHTVKTHRKNIIRKLGFTFKNASELALLITYLNDILI